MSETVDQFANRLGITDGLKDINQFRITKRSDGLFYPEISVLGKSGWHTIPNAQGRTYEEVEAKAFKSFTDVDMPEGNVVGSHNGEFVTDENYHLETDMGYGEPEEVHEGIVHGFDPSSVGAGGE